MDFANNGLAVFSRLTVVSENICQDSKTTNHLSSHHVQLPIKKRKYFLVPYLQLA
jgi:hypothetical protein